MARKNQESVGNFIGRLLYYAFFILILASGVYGYFVWLDSYKSTHPEIIEAIPSGYVEEQPFEGILLWDEQLVYAPQEGVLNYLSPKPRRVAKGENIAALDGAAVKAPFTAYFIPALDGQEGHWTYSRLWPDFNPFPFFRPAVLLENGIMLRRGAPIGKLVPQPQNLRCIAYLDRSPSLERSFKMNNPVISIKTALDDKEIKAEVVAFKSLGQKAKVYLRLPFFPPELLKSRGFNAHVVTGAQRGVMIPDTAVITRGGQNLVFVLRGNQIESRDIDGFPVIDNKNNKNFFVMHGLRPGDRMIRDADGIQDIDIRIW